MKHARLYSFLLQPWVFSRVEVNFSIRSTQLRGHQHTHTTHTHIHTRARARTHTQFSYSSSTTYKEVQCLHDLSLERQIAGVTNHVATETRSFQLIFKFCKLQNRYNACTVCPPLLSDILCSGVYMVCHSSDKPCRSEKSCRNRDLNFSVTGGT